jgi:Domain of unknown function (DUF4167)
LRNNQNKHWTRRRNSGHNPHSKFYESNGPDVKVRGTASTIAEKYQQLARDAHTSGDLIGPRGARNKLGEAFLHDHHADWEKHGRSVIERVRRDDPSAYLRVIASVVRPASEPEDEDPLADMTFEELKTELLAGLVSLFPELRAVPAQGQALIARTRDG